MINQMIVSEMISQLGMDPAEVKLLGGYNSNVFEVGLKEPFIVKIMERSHHSERDTLSELEWLGYLHSQGVNVVQPLCTNGNGYIQPLDDEYYYVAFKKINGVHISPDQHEAWGDTLFEKWGEVLGKVHSTTKRYSAVHDRPHWDHNSLLLNVETLPLKPQLIQKWKQYIKELHALPISSDTFGLIHGDLHYGNLLTTGTELTLIDFGDSEYHWFAYDIAIVIYHASLTVQKSERDEFAQNFFSSFMSGYTRSNPNTSFIKDIAYFIDFRHLYSFTYHSLHLDKSALTEEQLRYLHEMEESLLKDSPFLNTSFT
ncbi:phosphotransferase enzyme family protein [Paenibacillus sp. GCM10012306]|uniref:phosphotransferase enzyme family protein n=1 Tax=Paenibacillus sp. GCM10012306 TaxID=3317342 RepID=UPI00360BB155